MASLGIELNATSTGGMAHGTSITYQALAGSSDMRDHVSIIG
jgi:hypothetical protein